jgi:hypothetical protein
VYSLLVILPHVGHAFRPDSLQKLDMLNFLNSKLLPCGQTGIESGNFNSKDFIIYPNPATENVHLQTNNENIKCIKLFNSQGQFIQEYFTNDFSVTNLAHGIYFLRIETDKSIFTNKLIKE